MTSEDLTIKTYLETIYSQCNGDIEQQVSMYKAGEALGLEKNQAGALAEELMVQGLLELKTLAGNVSLTGEGLSFLGIAATDQPQQNDDLRLSRENVINTEDASLIEQLINETKKVIGSHQLEYALLEILLFDIKTLEVQLLSPQPKTAIIREIFASMQQTLSSAGLTDTAEKISCCLN